MKNRLSFFTLIAMMGVMLWCTAVFYPRYKQYGSNATLAWDAAGYYWYLPSVFIYHDLAEQRWADSIINKYHPGPEDVTGFGFRAENGHFVMKYPAGMALVEAPFFFLAHCLAKPLGYPPDGFSLPYQAAIQFGALLVSFLGLCLFRRLLLLYYSDGIVALCLLVLVVGTNYLNYSAIDGSIAHSWLFTLYVALMLSTRSFFRNPSNIGAVGIGALCGLAALIRPTDIIACLIPMLWGLESIRWHALRMQLRFHLLHARQLLLAALAGGCILAVQPLYWKLMSGNWLVYSYGDQEFSWKHPHIWDYTFSYRSGWLMYTPVMILAIIGFVPFLFRGPQRVMIIVFSAIAFYIVTAWDIWWYAGTGGRAMIQYYPALFIPLAALLTWLAARRWGLLVAAPVLLLLMYINVWFTWHAHGGGLYDSDGGMTRAYYHRVIGRWTAPDEVVKLRDGPYLYGGTIPESARLVYSNSLAERSGAPALVMDSSHQYSSFYKFAYQPQEGERWLRASADFRVEEQEYVTWQMTQFVLGIQHGRHVVRQGTIRVQRFTEVGRWVRLWVDLELPPIGTGDSVSIHFWHGGGKTRTQIRDLRVLAF